MTYYNYCTNCKHRWQEDTIKITTYCCGEIITAESEQVLEEWISKKELEALR